MSSVSFKELAAALYQGATEAVLDRDTNAASLIELSERVEKLAAEILQEAPSEDNAAALSILVSTRNVIRGEVDVVAAGSVVGNSATDRSLRLYANTVCPKLPVTVMNVGYNRLQFPTVSTYHQIAPEIAGCRLSPSCAPLLPRRILETVPLEGQQVDLFNLILDTRGLIGLHNYGRPFNLDTHLWVHHDILPGGNANKSYPMGLYPVCGVYSAARNTSHKKPAPIALGQLQPMRVHAHPHGKSKKACDMLYSPDDAHFMVDRTSPFSVTWMATQDGRRTLVARLLMIHDYTDPLMHAVVQASKNCQEIGEHNAALNVNVDKVLQTMFAPILLALKSDEPEAALKLFDSLPEWQKNNVYKHAYFIKGSPQGVSDDLGSLSFHNSEKIEERYHLSKEERMQALANHIQEMQYILAGETTELLTACTDISLSEDADTRTLLALAQRFESEDESALKEFDELDRRLKGQVFGAIWRINGHPRVDKFGENRFKACDNQERAQALYLAASSQPLVMPKIAPSDVDDIKGAKAKESKEAEVMPGSAGTLPTQPLSQPTVATTGVEKDVETVASLTLVLSWIDMLSAVSDLRERNHSLSQLFDTHNIDRETVKLPIYREIGRKAGKSTPQREGYGRDKFLANPQVTKEVIEAMVKTLEHKIFVKSLD